MREMGKREQQNKRSYEQVDGDDSIKEEQMDTSLNDTNNNANNKINNKSSKANKEMKQATEQAANVKEEEEYDYAEQDEDDEDEEDVVEEEEEIEEEVEEDEEEEDDEGGRNETDKGKSGNQNPNQSSQGSSGQQGGSANANAGQAGGNDKRPRLTDELYEMNLRRKKEHVGSALYIPFPRKVTEEEVRSFVGQGPNIFLVGPQKQNAIVRYRTQADCERQQKELAKKEFESQTLNIEPKTVKIDPANIDVKTLIVQYSNPDLTIMDFAQIFIKAISISLKGGKSKKESQEDLSFGSAIIIFSSHEEAKEAFLATENLNIKGEQLRVVFADFRPAGSGTRVNQGFGFRNKSGDNNRGNFNRGNQGGGGRQGGGGGGNFRNRNRNSSGGGGGGQRNFGNRNFNQNSGGGGNYGQGRNYSPNKKFRANVR